MPAPFADTLRYLFDAGTGTYQDTAGATPATAGGDSVKLWRYGSGGQCDLAAAANVPVLRLAQVNGLPALEFSGSQFLNFTNAFISPNRTIYAVLNVANGGVNTIVCGFSQSLQWRIDGLKQRLVNTATADIGFGTNSFSSGAWTQVNVSWDGTNGVFRTGRAADGSVSAGSYSAFGACQYCGVQSGTAEFFTGKIAFLAEYAAVHNTTDRQTVESYLNGIYGV